MCQRFVSIRPYRIPLQWAALLVDAHRRAGPAKPRRACVQTEARYESGGASSQLSVLIRDRQKTGDRVHPFVRTGRIRPRGDVYAWVNGASLPTMNGPS